jgi:hypothetical protein
MADVHELVKPNLALIRGGKLSNSEFSSLGFDEKLSYLKAATVNHRMGLIIEDPDGGALTKGLSPQEFYLMSKEIGETDISQLLANCSAEQLSFLLDLELWHKWEFSNDKAIDWLELLLSGDEPDAMRLLSKIDPELLQLVLIQEIFVGGGAADLATDSERLEEWDHSFDGLYYITFRNDKHARLIGTFLDIIFRNDRALYLDFMEGCRAAVKDEIEDLCYQFRSGRLADLGFPSYEQAIEIYSPLPPDAYMAEEEKIPLVNEVGNAVTAALPIHDDTLISRVLAATMTESLRQELGGLLNSAMVAEGGGGIDEESARSVHKRVYGWLNVALEHLCGDDEAAAAMVIRQEPLKRLFQRGYGIVYQVARLSRNAVSDEYATGKALRGFRANRPLFYRGLDPDRVDDYREFRTMGDIRMAREFLNLLQGDPA